MTPQWADHKEAKPLEEETDRRGELGRKMLVDVHYYVHGSCIRGIRRIRAKKIRTVYTIIARIIVNNGLALRRSDVRVTGFSIVMEAL